MCEFCNDIKTESEFFESVGFGKKKFATIKKNNNYELSFYPEDDPYYSCSMTISYCPKCGRKLVMN